jgi:hypothetical protein
MIALYNQKIAHAIDKKTKTIFFIIWKISISTFKN